MQYIIIPKWPILSQPSRGHFRSSGGKDTLRLFPAACAPTMARLFFPDALAGTLDLFTGLLDADRFPESHPSDSVSDGALPNLKITR